MHAHRQGNVPVILAVDLVQRFLLGNFTVLFLRHQVLRRLVVERWSAVVNRAAHRCACQVVIRDKAEIQQLLARCVLVIRTLPGRPDRLSQPIDLPRLFLQLSFRRADGCIQLRRLRPQFRLLLQHIQRTGAVFMAARAT
jgi:hypothetical protein